MCGIFGGVGLSDKDVRECLEVILRGFDGITVKSYGNVIFGSRRHLVKESGKADILPGYSDQPYESSDGQTALVFNGEFYNYNIFKNDLKLKGVAFNTEGDTEVFLKLFETYGIDFLKIETIDSFFTLSILDRTGNKLYIARDWPGRVPLFYYYNKENKQFIFSSELKGFKPLKWMYLGDPVELKPGHVVELDLKTYEITESQFYKPKYRMNKTTSLMEVGEGLYNILQESGKNRTMGDVPICTMLSGGIDSTLSTFFVFSNIDFRRVSYQPVSYVFAIDDYISEDVRRAKLAADGFKEIGLTLKEIRVPGNRVVEDLPHIIELFEMRNIKALSVYPLPIYYYLAPEMNRDGFKVTTGGHGVDELLGAYDAWKELDKSHRVQIDIRSRLAFMNAIYENMMRRASIIFMNRGPIEARFPFLSVKVCEYMLGIDSKWLSISAENAELLLDLIEKKAGPKNSWTNQLSRIHEYLSQYLDSGGNHPEDISEEEKTEMEKLFWKLPLMVAGMIASERSFLPFHILFNSKLRGQHGAGITSLEQKIVSRYQHFGATDSEIFQRIVKEKFNL